MDYLTPVLVLAAAGYAYWWFLKREKARSLLTTLNTQATTVSASKMERLIHQVKGLKDLLKGVEEEYKAVSTEAMQSATLAQLKELEALFDDLTEKCATLQSSYNGDLTRLSGQTGINLTLDATPSAAPTNNSRVSSGNGLGR